MLPTPLLRSRAAWKGPFFTSFPGIQQALQSNSPIRTSARACTILPNFIGSASFPPYPLPFPLANPGLWFDMTGISHPSGCASSSTMENSTFQCRSHPRWWVTSWASLHRRGNLIGERRGSDETGLEEKKREEGFRFLSQALAQAHLLYLSPRFPISPFVRPTSEQPRSFRDCCPAKNTVARINAAFSTLRSVSFCPCSFLQINVIVIFPPTPTPSSGSRQSRKQRSEGLRRRS